MNDQELRDRIEIADLIQRYSQVSSQGDFDAWAACFTLDGCFVTDGTEPGKVVRFRVDQDLARFTEIARGTGWRFLERRFHQDGL